MNDYHETHHFLRGTSQAANDIFSIFTKFLDTNSKKNIRACSKRLKSVTIFSEKEVNELVKLYFSTRKDELVDYIKLMFTKIGKRDSKVPCYPFFIFACCDCHEYLPLNKESKVYKFRHHEGEEGCLFPQKLKFLRSVTKK